MVVGWAVKAEGDTAASEVGEMANFSPELLVKVMSVALKPGGTLGLVGNPGGAVLLAGEDQVEVASGEGTKGPPRVGKASSLSIFGGGALRVPIFNSDFFLSLMASLVIRFIFELATGAIDWYSPNLPMVKSITTASSSLSSSKILCRPTGFFFMAGFEGPLDMLLGTLLLKFEPTPLLVVATSEVFLVPFFFFLLFELDDGSAASNPLGTWSTVCVQALLTGMVTLERPW